MNVKLVTLSACDTGVGPVGEAGIANLVNAFIEAGADSVVSTLWELEDHTTEAHDGRILRTTCNRSAESRCAPVRPARAYGIAAYRHIFGPASKWWVTRMATSKLLDAQEFDSFRKLRIYAVAAFGPRELHKMVRLNRSTF